MINESMVILMAEDDEGHASLVQRNLKRAGIVNQIVHVKDGHAALDYIRREGDFKHRLANAKLLLLLDIKMPKLDGLEVLRQLRANPALASIPVIVSTTTDDPREVERCYQLGCNVYVTKPVEYEAFVEAVKRLGLFLQVVRVPNDNV